MEGILQSAMDAIISIDEHQHIVLFNQAAERMFEWSVAEMMGQPLDRLIPRAIPPHASRAYQAVRSVRCQQP